jgi:hypothetical protein
MASTPGGQLLFKLMEQRSGQIHRLCSVAGVNCAVFADTLHMPSMSTYTRQRLMGYRGMALCMMPWIPRMPRMPCHQTSGLACSAAIHHLSWL